MTQEEKDLKDMADTLEWKCSQLTDWLSASLTTDKQAVEHAKAHLKEAFLFAKGSIRG